MQTIEYYRNQTGWVQKAVLLTLFLGVAFYIYYLAFVRVSTFLSIVATICLGLYAYGVYKLVIATHNKEPLCIMNEDGFVMKPDFSSIKYQKFLNLSWDDIEGVSLERDGRYEVITFFLKYPEIHYQSLSNIEKIFTDRNIRNGLGQVVIPLNLLDEIQPIRFYEEIKNFSEIKTLAAIELEEHQVPALLDI